MKISPLLQVTQFTHEYAGEVIELYSPVSSDGGAAYRLWFKSENQDDLIREDEFEASDVTAVEVGMGLMLSPESARKLAKYLLEVTGGPDDAT